MTVAALFVDARGVYPQLLGRENCWANDPDDGTDDARQYGGWPDAYPTQTGPVVAHPPCNLWVNMAAVNWKRYGRQRPAWYPGGDDGGCFASALASVRAFGGVLEHPAGSHAWSHHLLGCPMHHGGKGWHLSGPNLLDQPAGVLQEWQCEVWQSAYGSRMRKRTWLLYCGAHPPFELDWRREPGTHQCGWFDRNKPTVGKREASATPEPFARELIRLAEWSRG